MIRGVDVSSFQGAPSQWRTAAGAIQFAAVKFTELEPSGTRYVNPDAAADWAWLKQAGRARIAYLFAHPATSASATVSLFASEVRRAGLAEGDIICIDLETADGTSPGHVAAWAAQVAELLTSELSRIPLLYTFLNFAESGNCAGLGHLPLWIADPSSAAGHPRVPAPWSEWVIHQYAITGGIDRDVAAYASPAAMSAALGKQGDDMPLSNDDRRGVWTIDGVVKTPTGNTDNPYWTPASMMTDIDEQIRATRAQVAAMSAVLAQVAGQDTAAIIAGVLKGLAPDQLAGQIIAALGEKAQEVLAALQAALAKASR